jgi:oxygen-dependent protoporphyrinogen oxidase
VDEGPDAFLGRVPAAGDLARQLGLEDELVAPAQSTAFVWVNEELHRLPAEHVLGVPTDLNALLASRICTRSGIAALRKDVDFGSDPLEGPDVSVGEMLRSRIGNEVTERLVAPLVGGINGGDIDELSLAAVTPQLDAAARSGKRSLVRACALQRRAAVESRPAGEPAPPVFLAPRRGMGRLVEALEDDLHRRGVVLRIGTAASSLRRAGDGWEVAVEATSGDARADPVAADVLVLAAPATIGAALLAEVAPGAAGFLAGIAHASVALTTFSFDRSQVAHPLDGSGFLVPRREGLLLTAASWSSAKWTHLAPEHGDGTVLVRASAGRVGDDRAFAFSDEGLADHLLADLRRTMGSLGEPVSVRVSRFPSSFPQYAPGHLERVSAAEEALAEDAPGVALAGSALRGVGIPACIASGVAAADRLLRDG